MQCKFRHIYKFCPSSTVTGADTKNIDSLPKKLTDKSRQSPKKHIDSLPKKLTDKSRQSPKKSSSAFARNLPNPTFHFTHFSTSLVVSQNLKVLASLNMTHHTMIAGAHAHPHLVSFVMLGCLIARFFPFFIYVFTYSDNITYSYNNCRDTYFVVLSNS
jgi:hypothetical protein